MSAVPSTTPPADSAPTNESAAGAPASVAPGRVRESAGDPLLAALVAISKHYGIAVSRESLLAGLPVPENGILSPALFVRAAERAGLAATPHLRAFERIEPLALPVVLLLGDGGVCILTRFDGKEASVVFPDLGEGEVPVAREALAARYSGRLIYVKPRPVHEERRQRSDPLKPQAWFWDVVRLMRGEYTMTIVSAAAVNVLALTLPLFTMNVYDRVLPNSAFSTLWVLAIGVTIVLAFDFALRTLRGVFVDVAGRRADILLSSHMFEHLVDMRLAQRPRSSGELANRLRDFEIVREFFTSSTIATLTDIAFMAVFLAVIALIGGVLVFVPMAAIAIVVLIGLSVQPALKRNLETADRQSAMRHSHLVETISGLEAVKTLNAQGQLQRSWDRMVTAAAQTARDTRYISLFALNATSFVQQSVNVAIILWGAYLFSAKSISMGAIIATVMLASRCVAPLGGLAGMLVRLQQALVAFQGLDRFMVQDSETPRARAPLHRKIARGSVAFRRVEFSYPDARTPALTDISFTIKPGEKVAVLGRVGSGKTTLGRLLLGLYTPAGGTIMIDDVDVRQYHPAELRRGVGVIMQDVTLFSGTVRENIAFGSPWADDAQVLRAARLAGADEFIRENPQGYDLQVGERGQLLSGGQRQSIALARALFHDPPILFLDEPTSAMDPRAEREFIVRMKRVLQAGPRTLIVSTHRRSLLDLVDRIIILERGVVAADGPKAQVMDRLQSL